jgi:hypothetical protein
VKNREDDDYLWEGRDALLTKQLNRIIAISLSAGFDCGYIYSKHEATQTLVEAGMGAKAKLVQLAFDLARHDMECVLEDKPTSSIEDPVSSGEIDLIHLYAT